MKNKKTSMLVAGILILLYHLWSPIGTIGSGIWQAEKQLLFFFFIGVDMFFFLSAYSLSRKEGDFKWHIKKCKEFYFEFVIFTVLYVFLNNRKPEEIPNTLSFYNFLKLGGGSFLWFIPAIIILYLVFWVALQIEKNSKTFKKYSILFGLLVVFWLCFSMFTSFTTHDKYRAVLIFLNRVPVIVLACVFEKYNLFEKLREKKALYAVLTVVLIVGGFALLKFVGYPAYQNRMSLGVYDLFYLTGLPSTLGVIMLCDLVPCPAKIGYLASSTLELYGIQMILATKLQIYLPILTGGSIVLTNIVSVLIVCVLAVMMYAVKKNVKDAIKDEKANNQATAQAS